MRARSIALVAFAWLCYALYVRTMILLVAFLGRFWIAKHVDAGTVHPPAVAAAADLGLLALFAVPHSLMARPSFKRWIAAGIPEVLERSLYVLVSSALLALCVRLWLPIPEPGLHARGDLARGLLRGASVAGWLLGLAAIHTQGHLRLFGVRRAWERARGRPPAPEPLVTRGLYARARHPMYLGFLVGCWSTPDLTAGHALFAGALTLYVALGRRLEERDLRARYGESYERYATDVPAFLPRR